MRPAPTRARGSALAALLLAAALAAPEATARPLPGEAPEAEAFSALDRRAVEVGGVVEMTVEVAAAARTEAVADRWEARLAAADVPRCAGVEIVRTWPVTRRWEGGVVQLHRRFALRVVRAGALEVPPVRVGPLATRPQALRAFAAWPREAARSVVPIVAEGVEANVPFQRVGTAWLAAPDALVTAYHVVVGADRVRARLPSGETVTLRRAWALDPDRDVAVLHVAPRHTDGMAALVVAPEAGPAASGADVAFTAGWPLGSGAPGDGFERQRVWTTGALYAGIGTAERRVRVSANAVRSGDSGGPLLDASGRVLGVVVSGRSTKGEPDLLREDVSLAADPVPALRQRRDRPAPLARALREAAAREPTARAFEAATALVTPMNRRADTRHHRAALLRAVREAPGDPALQFLAGSVFEALGDEAEAARAYHGAHAAGYFPAAYALANHYLDTDPARAAVLFAEVRRSAPYAHLGAMGHARALVDLARWDEAAEALEEVLDHDSRFGPALYFLGVVRLAQGREGAAEALAHRLAPRPVWADALRRLLDQEVLRPSALRALPRADLGRVPAFAARR